MRRFKAVYRKEVSQSHPGQSLGVGHRQLSVVSVRSVLAPAAVVVYTFSSSTCEPEIGRSL